MCLLPLVERRFEGLLQTGHGRRKENWDVAGAHITWAPLTFSHDPQDTSTALGSGSFYPHRLSWAGHLSQGAIPAPDPPNPLMEGLNLRHRWVYFLPLPTWEV